MLMLPSKSSNGVDSPVEYSKNSRPISGAYAGFSISASQDDLLLAGLFEISKNYKLSKFISFILKKVFRSPGRKNSDF